MNQMKIKEKITFYYRKATTDMDLCQAQVHRAGRDFQSSGGGLLTYLQDAGLNIYELVGGVQL